MSGKGRAGRTGPSERKPAPRSKTAATTPSTGYTHSPQPETVLDLQRTAGNRGVAHLLQEGGGPIATAHVQRQGLPESSFEPGAPAQGHGLSDREVSFAFFFTGNDSFGKAAQSYVKAYYPDHRRFDAKSFEDLFAILGREGHRLQKAAGATPLHVDEIVIVTHANAGGGMKIPLTAADSKRKFSPAEVDSLQEESRRGLHDRFLKTRRKALGGIDARTKIIVRGCELGKESEQPLDALGALFGGRATVMAPRAFQGFSVEQIGAGRRLTTKVQAFDMLVEVGYLKGMDDLDQKAKEDYINTHFSGGIPTDFFIVSEADYKAFKAMGIQDRLGEAGEGVKKRDVDPTRVYEGKASGAPDALWESHVRGARRSAKPLSRADAQAEAEALMSTYEPSKAGKFLQLWDAWQTPTPVPGDLQLVKTPAVFGELNIRRARRDLFDHPDAARDVFSSEDLSYTATGQGGFDRSEATAGSFEASTAAGATGGVEVVGPDHIRIWGFAANETLVTADFQKALVDFAGATPASKPVTVTGHTDSTGSDAVNLKVSRQRADSVISALVEAGMDPAVLHPVGSGESTPLVKEGAGAAAAAARARNRRVDVVRGAVPPARSGGGGGGKGGTGGSGGGGAGGGGGRRAGRWPKAGKGRVEPVNPQDLLAGMRFYGFERGQLGPDGNHRRGLKSMAMVHAKRDPRDKRRLIVEGHSSSDESATVSEARARAVAAQLMADGVPGAQIIDVLGLKANRPLSPEKVGGKVDAAAMARNRRVEILLRESADYVRVDPGTAGGGTDGRVGSDAPDKGTAGDEVQKGEQAALAFDILTNVTQLMAFEIAGIVLGPALVTMNVWAALDDLRKTMVRVAYRDGLLWGFGNCWSSMSRTGSTAVTYDQIWLIVESMSRPTKYVPAEPYQSAAGMSMGVKVSIDLWDKLMEETDRQIRFGIWKLMHSQKRGTDGWEKIFEAVKQDIRKAVAARFEDLIATEAKKLFAKS